jgi:hypothetical protein
MGNQIFRDRLNHKIEKCILEAQDCVKLEHNGMAGNVREILVQELLLPLLPEGIHIGSGKVTDSSGNLSSQSDIIIYDRRTVPPILYDEKLGVFPIESVYYVIEIKTNLTKDEFKKSIQNGQKLRSLRGLQPHSALFAFNSNLKDSKDSERFIQKQKDMLVPLPINIFCVVGKEYGYWDKGWNILPDTDNNIAIVSFLVGIINTLVKARHFRQPSLDPGWYFFPGYDPSS